MAMGDVFGDVEKMRQREASQRLRHWLPAYWAGVITKERLHSLVEGEPRASVTLAEALADRGLTFDDLDGPEGDG